MAITMEKGYARAVAAPSKRLLSKLEKLGWKKGQTIYVDPGNLEMKFFDSRDELDEFLERRNTGLFSSEDPSWDVMADIELKIDEYENSIQ